MLLIISSPQLFHKQWYFSKMVPQLVALYHSSVSIRSHVISVLSVLMQSVPKLVLLNELPKVSLAIGTRIASFYIYLPISFSPSLSLIFFLYSLSLSSSLLLFSLSFPFLSFSLSLSLPLLFSSPLSLSSLYPSPL